MTTGDAMTAGDRCGDAMQRSGLWTLRRCARGHVVEHPGAVTIADLGADCWCGAPGQAVTVCAITLS